MSPITLYIDNYKQGYFARQPSNRIRRQPYVGTKYPSTAALGGFHCHYRVNAISLKYSIFPSNRSNISRLPPIQSMARKRRGHRALGAPYSYHGQSAPMILQSLQKRSISSKRPRLHTFSDKALEKRVFTHKSAGIQQNSLSAFFASSVLVEERQHNEHLQFLGDSVLKGLTAHLIDNLFPDMDEETMTVHHTHIPAW